MKALQIIALSTLPLFAFGLVLNRVHRSNLLVGATSLTKEAKQELVQAYFRLGVSTACNVILKHELKREPIPDPQPLLEECIRQDIELSKGDTLLKLPSH